MTMLSCKLVVAVCAMVASKILPTVSDEQLQGGGGGGGGERERERGNQIGLRKDNYERGLFKTSRGEFK